MLTQSQKSIILDFIENPEYIRQKVIINILQLGFTWSNSREVYQLFQTYWENGDATSTTVTTYVSEFLKKFENFGIVELIRAPIRIKLFKIKDELIADIGNLLYEYNFRYNKNPYIVPKKLIPLTKEQLKQIDIEINGESTDNKIRKRIIVIGGFPEIIKKFQKVCEQYKIEMIVLESKIREMPQKADVIIFCTKCMSHSQTQLSIKYNKGNIPYESMRTFSVSEFWEILLKYFPDIKKSETITSNAFETTTSSKEIIPETIPETISYEETISEEMIDSNASEETISEEITSEEMIDSNPSEETISYEETTSEEIKEGDICLINMLKKKHEDKITKIMENLQNELIDLNLSPKKIKLKSKKSEVQIQITF